MKATTGGEINSLESRAQQYRAILDSALDAIITINAAGAIVEFNPAAVRV
jgi:PAS domain S-box-containing protein